MEMRIAGLSHSRIVPFFCVGVLSSLVDIGLMYLVHHVPRDLVHVRGRVLGTAAGSWSVTSRTGTSPSTIRGRKPLCSSQHSLRYPSPAWWSISGSCGSGSPFSHLPRFLQRSLQPASRSSGVTTGRAGSRSGIRSRQAGNPDFFGKVPGRIGGNRDFSQGKRASHYPDALCQPYTM